MCVHKQHLCKFIFFSTDTVVHQPRQTKAGKFSAENDFKCMHITSTLHGRLYFLPPIAGCINLEMPSATKLPGKV